MLRKITSSGMARTIPHNPIQAAENDTPINALNGRMEVLEAVKYGVTKLPSIC